MPAGALGTAQISPPERTHPRRRVVDGAEVMRTPSVTPAGRDLSCVRCGYGVATGPPPRCPMCNGETEWVDVGTTRLVRW
jgi:rubrerythrin